MIVDERCVMCESCAGELVEHFTCGEFEKDRWVVVNEESRIVGAGGIWKSMQGD